MDSRFYQPQLLWGYFQRWAQSKAPEIDLNNHPQLFIYRKSGPGAYYMHGRKLYWDDDPSDGYFANCDQDALAEVAANDELGEVQGFIYRGDSRNPVHWVTFEEFVAEITGKATNE